MLLYPTIFALESQDTTASNNTLMPDNIENYLEGEKMSYLMRIVGYGVIIEDKHLSDMLGMLAEPLTMEQKKRFYIGHNVLEPIDYEDMNSHDKKLYDEVDVNNPSFLKTDFGDHWIDYLDMYLDKHYPSLCVSFAAESDDIAVYAGTTRSKENLADHEGLYKFWKNYED